MRTLRFLLGDQLDRQVSALRDLDPSRDVVLMAEVYEEATTVRHHKQKVALVFAAMRHFARELCSKEVAVDYVQLDDPGNSGSLAGELRRALARHRVERVVMTEPSEWRVWSAAQRWRDALGVPIEIRDDDRFFCSRAEFAAWAEGRKSLRMEYFYRVMRRKTGWLMEGSKPTGGRWNYDAQNRKPLPRDLEPPSRLRFAPDAETEAVLDLVARRFGDHFGDLRPFRWAVNRRDALRALAHFVRECLPNFGDYQDAMRSGEDWLYHAVLSPYLNLGLLRPREVCQAALQALDDGAAPLHAVEGFVRQILGWREYVRGVYWLHMPGYGETNYLDATRDLPDFYWSGETDLNCLREVVAATRRNAYAHHIQRLMVTGNFALLAGLAPAQVNKWYRIVYADALEWVELPNTHGMALFADGGLLGSKPYAASGAYIHRMSDYCAGCAYQPTLKNGPRACPYNYLYWHFLIANQDRLQGNPRMTLAYRNLARLSDERKQQIVADAEAFLDTLEQESSRDW